MYPMKGSAAQVLGFAGIDNKGLAGMELQYDKQLAGEAGSEIVVRDPAGHALKTVAQRAAVPGATCASRSTRTSSTRPRTCSSRPCASSGAKAATAIVMDPRTGEILAMAQRAARSRGQRLRRKPANDATAPSPTSTSRARSSSSSRSPARSPTGSSSRPPSSRCRRASRSPTATINESHPRGTVTYSVREILQWSSNVGAVKIGMMMGKERLLKWIDAFGFGKPTGIDFPGRVGGIVPPAGLVGLLDRQHPHGPGHRRDADADGRGLLDGRQQRRGR